MNFQQKVLHQLARIKNSEFQDSLQIIVQPPKRQTINFHKSQLHSSSQLKLQIFQNRKKQHPKISLPEQPVYKQTKLDENSYIRMPSNFPSNFSPIEIEHSKEKKNYDIRQLQQIIEKKRLQKEREERQKEEAYQARLRYKKMEKEKEREKERERLKIKYVEVKKMKQKQANLLLLDLIGSNNNPTKKVKPNQNLGLRNQQLLQNLEQQIENNDEGKFQDQYERIQKKRNKIGYGTTEIVKNYKAENGQALIRLILSHQYHLDHLAPQIKKIPNLFKDKFVYKKTFQYLLANQCLADIKQRINKTTNNPYQSVQAQIRSIKKNNQGMLEIILRQKKNNLENDIFLLKNYSLSKNRLGIITSRSPFKIENYGVPSKDNPLEFAFLCLLCTPQTKEELNSDVKVIAAIKQYNIQIIMTQRKSNEVYFIDFQKISTNLREYLAVANLHFSDLAPFIYNPRLMEKHQSDIIQNHQILNPILCYLQKIFNKIQFESIREMVLRQYGIVLLQGPPGTGKTSTLLGLLSAQYEYQVKSKGKRKIMICAPSNAAVDHITKRIITQGLINGDGQRVNPKILRMGMVQTSDKDIKGVSLDDICQRLLVEFKNEVNNKNQLSTPEIKQKVIGLQKEMKKLLHQKNTNYTSQLDVKIKDKAMKIASFEKLLYQIRRSKVQQKHNYNQIERAQIDAAEIILTTLSSSGTDKMDRVRGNIGCLIVDEAAQATQPNLLVALQTGVQKVILIGDPYQLPATTLSTDSTTTLFNRSLFERFLDAGLKPYFLNIQYRMAPLIRQFPSNKFYQGRLQDSQSVSTRFVHEKLVPFVGRNTLFIDVPYGYEKFNDQSYENKFEAYAVTKILERFNTKDLSIGVITPYQAQRKLISRILDKSMYEKGISLNVLINTVDSFQGQQKDIIIISCVRSNDNSNIGFMTDERRSNVTLTRAKHLMIVLGRGDTLSSNEVWNDFVGWCENKQCYYKIMYEGQSDKVIDECFKGKCEKKFERKKYQVLSKDFRKYQTNEIKADDFITSKKKKKKIEQQKLKNNDRIKEEHIKQKDKKKQTNIMVMEQKQHKLEEGIRIQQINRNMIEIQKKIKNGEVEDQFLKMLLG